jgi:alkylhydroperoxidase family enzyme
VRGVAATPKSESGEESGMARIELPEGDEPDRARMWRLIAPEIGAAAERFSETIQRESIVPVPEHEAARIRIAHINGCEPCSDARIADMDAFGLDEAFYRDVDDPALRSRYAPRVRLAIGFAERFAAGAHAFDDAFWSELRAAFSDAEIVDLAASCAKWLGLGRINAVLDLSVACPIQIAPSRHARPLARS